MLVSVDPNGNRTESIFDKLNRRTTTKDALCGVGTLIYDKSSRVEASVGENGNDTTFNYDAINRRFYEKILMAICLLWYEYLDL